MSRIMTKTYEVFNYNELSDDAKEKVRQWWLEDQDAQFFKDDMVLENLNHEFGLTDLDCSFSLSSCQGDGLCLHGKIYFDDIRKNETLKEIAFANLTEDDFENLKVIEESCSYIDFHRINTRYAHANTVNIDIDYYVETEFEKSKPFNNILITKDKILKNIKKWYFEQCARFEKMGYEYFYEISDEDMAELCEANGYEFYENGKIA